MCVLKLKIKMYCVPIVIIYNIYKNLILLVMSQLLPDKNSFCQFLFIKFSLFGITMYYILSVEKLKNTY